MKQKLLIFIFLLAASYTGFSQNNYLDFDGVNDNVNVTGSENVLANATAITLSCKVFPKSTSTGFPNFDGFAGYRNETNFDFYIVQLNATEIEARFRNSSGVAYSISYTGLVPNQWNHFFLVYDGALLKLYSGTTMVGSIAASGSAPTSNNLTFKIGLVQFQSFSWYHNGYIDEVSLWNKGLTATEIATIIANNGDIANPLSENNLKLYYKFNQGIPYGTNTGLTSLTDEKATANGTLANFALTGNTSNWGSATLANTTFTTSKIEVYPNPSSEIINFSASTDINSITIMDLFGRVVLEKNDAISNYQSVNVSSLQSGTYIAIINNEVKLKILKK